MSGTHNKLYCGYNFNHWKFLDLFFYLNHFSFSHPNSNPNPTHLPKRESVSPNHQFSQRIRYVEYYFVPEMITIRFAGWISGRIVSLQPDTDIQELLSNGNRIRIRISETLSTIFWGSRLLEKVAHCTIIHLLFSEASFQPSVPWFRVCMWCNLYTVV